MLQSQKFLRFLIGFIGGFFSVLLFHQGSLALLHSLNFAPVPPYSMNPTRPFGIPQVWSLAIWGGFWGVILAALTFRLRRGQAFWRTSLLFSALVPTFVSLFIVLPLKGQPIAGGWQPRLIMTGLIVNAAWGIGTALLIRLYSRQSTVTNV